VTSPQSARLAPSGLLPARTRLRDHESLDSFLERLAAINDLLPPELLRLLTAPERSGAPSSAFLMVKPDPLIVERIVRLSGVDAEAVRRASLLRFGAGLPLRLDGLDPRRRYTLRQVAAQGWFPSFGTQSCPMCLAEDGTWALRWRLPIVAACTDHRVFLVTECAGCGGRFRMQRRAPLRPLLGREQPCGNPVSVRNPCRHPVIHHMPEESPPPVTAVTAAIMDALGGHHVAMLGTPADPRTFLAEIRHLATLLLHLVSRPRGLFIAPWAEVLHNESARRTTTLRVPRWGFSPPQSAVIRGHALAQAHLILGQSSVDDAATLLVPWLDCIADAPNGPSEWLVNRTTRTSTMEQLIHAATARRHHVGRRLNTIRGNAALRPAAIPQMMDADIYRDIFATLLGGNQTTGRLYASLCTARVVAPVLNWSDAAILVGLDAEMGIRTARAASKRMCVSPQVFADAVDRASHLLPAGRDFRWREGRVRMWFERWRIATSPARHATSLPNAITWMWCEVAQGLLDTSPAWSGRPTAQHKASYRAFQGSVPPSAQHDMRTFVLADS
jgi:hypothetical protein